MQIIKSTPKQPEFLKTYGKLLSISFAVSIFCQIVSSTTETGVFYSNFSSKFSFLGSWSIIPTLVLTIGFVAGLEIGGRALLSYAADSILYKRWKGLELFLSILVILFTVLLLKTSLDVSIEGAPEVIATFKEAPPLLSTDQIEGRLETNKGEVLKNYSNDSLLITSNSNNKIVTIKKQYDGKIEKLKMSIANYERKEKRSGKSYFSSINYLKGKIGELKAEAAAAIGIEEAKRADKMEELMEERKTSQREIKTQYRADKAQIDNSNNNLSIKHKTQIESNTGSLKNLVYACLFLFVLCVVVERIIYKGAGITFESNFSDYFYRESIFKTFLNFAGEKVQATARGKINEWHDKVEAPSLSERPTIIFDRVNNTQIVRTEKEDQEELRLIALNSNNFKYDKNKYVLSYNYKPLGGAPSKKAKKKASKRFLKLEAQIIKHTKNGDEVTAKQIIKAYLSAQNRYSKKEGKRLLKEVRLYIFGAASNPFETRRQIGFFPKATVKKSDGKNQHTETVRTNKKNVIINKNTKPCLHCGTEFLAAPKHKKFCTENCRKENWKQKNGRAPMMKKRK